MKKHLSLYLFPLFLCALSYGQNPSNEINKKTDDPNGTHTENYPNGMLKQSYTRKNGNKDGLSLFYHKNGNMYEECHFTNGHFNGTNKEFSEKGELQVEEHYVNDTLLYYREIVYYKSGKIRSERYLTFDKDSLKLNPFLKTKKKVHYTEYDVTLTFSHMKSHGKQIEYWENGKTKFEVGLVDNLLEGESKDYYDDGSLYISGNYHKDLSDGIFTYYSDTGQISKTENWKAGKKIK